jgi:hypothetical protein
MVVRIESIGLDVQDGNPHGFDKPNYASERHPNIDHASTIAKNAANIMASVIQYEVGFLSVGLLVVISIS